MSVERWCPGPVAPSLPGVGVDVWQVDLDDPHWRPPTGLSRAELARSELLLDGPVRLRWSASRQSLRAILGRYLGAQEGSPEEFVRGPHGKPALPGVPPALHFNLSHSGDLALVAVAARSEVGIDVERVDPRRDVFALIDRALDPDSRAIVLAASPDERRGTFYRQWVRREAIAKCTGEGLGGNPSADGIALRSIEMRAGYVAALAVADRRSACPCRHFTIAPPVPWEGQPRAAARS